jgi:hypothetical protein
MEERTVQKPLVGQIIDEMLASIEGQKEFDAGTIEKLRQLAASGGLKKPALVTAIMKSTSESTP